MNRTNHITREILEALAGWDAPASEAVIFNQVSARIPGGVMVSEWDDALGLCEQQRWVTGVRDALMGKLFTLTNKGRAQRTA